MFSGIHRPGSVLSAIPQVETSWMEQTYQGKNNKALAQYNSWKYLLSNPSKIWGSKSDLCYHYIWGGCNWFRCNWFYSFLSTQVHLFFPVIYVIASIFITIVPMVASPVETGTYHLDMIMIIMLIWLFQLQVLGLPSYSLVSLSTSYLCIGRTNQHSSRICSVCNTTLWSLLNWISTI